VREFAGNFSRQSLQGNRVATEFGEMNIRHKGGYCSRP
jgi:hypothetical protein